MLALPVVVFTHLSLPVREKLVKSLNIVLLKSGTYIWYFRCHLFCGRLD